MSLASGRCCARPVVPNPSTTSWGSQRLSRETRGRTIRMVHTNTASMSPHGPQVMHRCRGCPPFRAKHTRRPCITGRQERLMPGGLRKNLFWVIFFCQNLTVARRGHCQRASSCSRKRGTSRLSARATSRNSTTSKRRSPRSVLETNDWRRPRRSASSFWVRPASLRACTRSARNRPYFLRYVDLVTGDPDGVRASGYV